MAVVTADGIDPAAPFPADVEDIQRIIVFASRGGLQVAPQRTGHNAAPLGELDGVILLRTDALDEVTIDADAMRARVGSGVKWESVVPAVSDLGLQILGGYGYCMEYPMQRFFRDSRLAVIGGGTSEIQRNIIARGLGL